MWRYIEGCFSWLIVLFVSSLRVLRPKRFDDDSVLRNHTIIDPAVLTFAGGLTVAGFLYMHVGMTVDATVCLIDMWVYGSNRICSVVVGVTSVKFSVPWTMPCQPRYKMDSRGTQVDIFVVHACLVCDDCSIRTSLQWDSWVRVCHGLPHLFARELHCVDSQIL